MKSNSIVLLDEINLAPPEVILAISAILVGEEAHGIYIGGYFYPLNVKNATIFATMNPVAVGGGRQRLPESIVDCFVRVVVEEMSNIEIQDIVKKLFEG